MALTSNKLNVLIVSACVVGYAWLFFHISENFTDFSNFKVCLIKKVTGIPCPSCGTTRGVVSITKGHFLEAIQTNPFSFLVAITMIISPIWIAFDVIMKKRTLFNFYQKVEKQLIKPKIAILLIVLVLLNWIWNIAKGL
ncbi:DUF2752 domain-containing protein [Polaribacter sp.]|uniref:DUF2752 domain-containing protein n=1 Tax=Polaribacter sp. TaxID=1920175 RepID=UPI0040471920